jgi:hypothetical protein
LLILAYKRHTTPGIDNLSEYILGGNIGCTGSAPAESPIKHEAAV